MTYDSDWKPFKIRPDPGEKQPQKPRVQSALVLWLRRKSTKLLLDFIIMLLIVLGSAALLVWLFLP